MDRVKMFKELCKENPSICQEMANDNQILNLEMIKNCKKQGIKFDNEFILIAENINKIISK